MKRQRKRNIYREMYEPNEAQEEEEVGEEKESNKRRKVAAVKRPWFGQ
jgi:hypothetical protein